MNPNYFVSGIYVAIDYIAKKELWRLELQFRKNVQKRVTLGRTVRTVCGIEASNKI